MDTQQLKQLNVYVAGDVCLDVYCYGNVNRISPEAPVPVFEQAREESRMGMACNVFANLLSFGFKGIFDMPFRLSGGVKKRLVDVKSGQQLLRVDYGEDPSPAYSFFEQIDWSTADALVLVDYDKGRLPRDLCVKLTQQASFSGVPCFVDSKKRDLSCFVDSFVKINEKEADMMVNAPLGGNLVVTLGGRGARAFGKSFPGYKVQVSDVCGAGDVFLASLVFGFFNWNSDMDKTIDFANKCASLSVTKRGTHTLTPKEIEECLR